ncbi:MAG: ParB N-terminal domain-containing protein [Planctomycetota bacterium]|jgi:ParB/RepB/Spo0J family partition protein
MANSVHSIALNKLVAHPDNPNRQSKVNFAKLIRNIERTGRYEPLIVRPYPERAGYYQIINGHHRRQALSELGYEEADCIVWEIDDEQTDIMLATLNRLGGSDVLAIKVRLLERLNKKFATRELAKLLPQTKKQIERLTNLKMPSRPVKIEAGSFANPMVFFLNDRQQQIVEKALTLAAEDLQEKTKAARNAAALTHMAESFLNSQRGHSRSS